MHAKEITDCKIALEVELDGYLSKGKSKETSEYLDLLERLKCVLLKRREVFSNASFRTNNLAIETLLK